MSLSNAGYKKILHQLEIVLNHIVDHFDAEEQILKEIGYPDYEEHTSIHKNLVHQALELQRKLSEWRTQIICLLFIYR